MSTITFKKNGLTREVKVGYSWTVGLFGPFAFAARGHWAWAAGCFVLDMFTWGLGQVVLGQFANKITARWLVENGWSVSNPRSLPREWGIEA